MTYVVGAARPEGGKYARGKKGGKKKKVRQETLDRKRESPWERTERKGGKKGHLGGTI